MKKWIELAQVEKEKGQDAPEKIIDLILKNRGIKTPKEKEEFLNPPHPKDIPLSDLGIDKKDLVRAIARIKRAVEKKEKIVVYGDYDADGVCAAVVVWETLYRFFAAEVITPYIPNRFSEGYGLKIESLKKLKKEHPNLKLVITVDHGIVAHEAVKAAGELGLDVVIIDHHLPKGTKPGAFAIVHTTEICGVAAAWVVVRELTRGTSYFEKVVAMLDLVSIGTVADVMPLIGVNRSLVYWGLDYLENTKRQGLVELMKLAQIGAKFGKKKVGVWDIGFAIAPRLNAAGRLTSALDSVRLLSVVSQKRATSLAQLLNRTNQERQKIVEESLELTKGQFRGDEKIIFLANENYHEGIIGLVASKLVDAFHRPAIVVSIGDKYSKASGRSVEGFNIVEEILTELSDLGIEGGGHKWAFGFSFKTQLLDLIAERVRDIAERKLDEEILTRKIKIDCSLDFDLLNLDLARQIEKLGPFGPGNPEPVFATRDVQVKEARGVGESNQHLKFKFEKDGFIFGAIAFGKGEMLSQVGPGAIVDIAYNLGVNSWNGFENLDLIVKDLKGSA